MIVIASSMHNCSRLELTKNETRNKSIIQGDNLNHCAVNAMQPARGAAGVAGPSPRGGGKGGWVVAGSRCRSAKVLVEANA